MHESLEALLKILRSECFLITRNLFGDCWEFVKQILVYTYETLKKPIDYDK